MQVKRSISKRIRRVGNGIDLAADVNADIQVNVGSDRSDRTASTPPPSARDAAAKRKGKETQ